MAGRFRMGPFELMDLVGIDVGFEVTKSFWEQSFHEPRWRPSMIQARMVPGGAARTQDGSRLLRLFRRPAPARGPSPPGGHG